MRPRYVRAPTTARRSQMSARPGKPVSGAVGGAAYGVAVTARLPSGTTLRGRHVKLAPLDAHDGPALFRALADPSVWTWLSWPAPADATAMQDYVDDSLAERAAGVRFPWTVRTAAGEVVGWTSYADLSPRDGRLEIGWTAYGVPWQRSAVNTETKLLLLGHAFDDLGYQRVALKTDARNERSQAAIARIGGVREGVLRRHMRRSDASLRDTVYFSVLDDEWPAVRTALRERLERG